MATAAGLSRAAAAAPGTNEVHELRGVLRAIAPDHRTARIQHEAVPGYMPAMTMSFNVADTNELAGLAPGVTVTFTLTTTADSHSISHLRKVAAATAAAAAAPAKVTVDPPHELKEGDLLPDADLTGEDGKTVRFSDFRGRALALTFFFTRCPLPEFCPRMSTGFAEARAKMRTPQAPGNWEFLSISFDPDFDTPAMLAGYAAGYRGGDADRWKFAAAPRPALRVIGPLLDLTVQREKDGGITHNLRTVVLDTKGRIFRQFDGNSWTPAELAAAMVAAAAR